MPPWAFFHFTQTCTARTASLSNAPAGPDSVPTAPIRMGSRLPPGAGCAGAPGVGAGLAGAAAAAVPGRVVAVLPALPEAEDCIGAVTPAALFEGTAVDAVVLPADDATGAEAGADGTAGTA